MKQSAPSPWGLTLAAVVGVFAAMDGIRAAPGFGQAPATAVRAATATCESLMSLSLPHTTITLAENVSGGTFTPPETTAGGPPNRALANLPTFCRVTATLQPSTDSDIKIEVWLPTASWNGKLQAVGNGAWAGVISYPALGAALAGGYATAGTDTGHTGNNARFAVGHPEKMTDCDGVTDGLIENPTTCRFDPRALECSDGDAPSCLTAGQVEAARKIYAPAVNPRTRQEIYPGLQPGSELAWSGLAGPQPAGEAVELFKYVVFNDEHWDFRALAFDTAVTSTDKAQGGVLNATDANLKPFIDRGGKLLLYHGWNDQLVAPLSTVHYYDRVLQTTGRAKTADSVRLFMMPGMTHCAGGEGPDSFDKVGIIERWVERGQAPDRIVASHSTDGKVDRTRPLCPYPQVAAYNGTGRIDDAASFVCNTK